MGEGFDVAGDVGAVFEFAPHVADGSGEAVQFGGEVEARRGRDGRVRGGVTADAVDAAPYPQGEQGDEGEGCAEVKQAALAQVVFGALLVGDEVGAGFAEADDAEQAAVGGVDGGGDVHGVLGAARAVLAAQGAQDVVPAAVVFAGLRRFAVKEDDARAIGDDELLAVRGFVVLVDVDVLRAGEAGAQLCLPGGFLDVAVFQRGRECGGERLGVVGEGVFQHFFHARADLLLHVAQEQRAAEGEREAVHEKEADEVAHGRPQSVCSGRWSEVCHGRALLWACPWRTRAWSRLSPSGNQVGKPLRVVVCNPARRNSSR